ncbi:hypothetical protein Tco_0497730 [Tanacetum coccineum]
MIDGMYGCDWQGAWEALKGLEDTQIECLSAGLPLKVSCICACPFAICISSGNTKLPLLSFLVHLAFKSHKKNRLKKAIAAQPKMYDGDMLHSEKLIINSTDSEETLEDAEESQIKMKDKMIQFNYDKINALYETFVPQQEISAEQTYFSIPSTSNHSSESKDVPSESLVLKMPNESRLLKMIDKLGNALTGFYTKIHKTLLKDADRRWLSDNQNELREFYKTDVIPTSRSLYKNLQDIKEELIKEVREMLNIFESMEQRVNEKSPTDFFLQKEIDRLLEMSLISEIQDCMLLSAA